MYPGAYIGECTADRYRAIFVDDGIVNAQGGNNRRRITDSYAGRGSSDTAIVIGQGCVMV